MGGRTILVTGANRGIGLCIVQSLAEKTPEDQIILAARSKDHADAAIAQLRSSGADGNISSLQLDVTVDDSIAAAVAGIKQRYGILDVLINNAGIAAVPEGDLQSRRATYNEILNTNVTSVANVSLAFMPLLTQNRSSSDQRPRIINISSGRASLSRTTTGSLPPTVSIPYSISKVALNALTIEMQKTYQDVLFYATNPGHCKTQFNHYRGTREPLEGARVVTELVNGDYEWGFWETTGSKGEATLVPW